MLSFFSTRRDRGEASEPPDSTPPGRMDLPERKLYRREMLYQAIRESLLSLEVIPSMYKFKVMNVDERHHRFIVMIDVTQSFRPHQSSQSQSLCDIEDFIKANAFDRFGLVLEGIYWRVSSTNIPFERQSRAADSPETASAILARNRQQAPVNDPFSATQRLARQEYQPISEEEKQAFSEAIRRGASPPALRVGEKEYQSDHAPLDGGDRTGGTQYGKL